MTQTPFNSEQMQRFLNFAKSNGFSTDGKDEMFDSSVTQILFKGYKEGLSTYIFNPVDAPIGAVIKVLDPTNGYKNFYKKKQNGWAPMWQKIDRSFSEYPIGTKARNHWAGGYWTKNENGWKWFCGDTFSTPGGANEVMLPEIFSDIIFKKL